MKLERSNIEAWLLDRIEGRLTPDQLRELEAFLLANPDLADEFEELPSLENENVTFPGKDRLKRSIPPTGTITAANLDEFLVALVEDHLSPEKKAELDRYIADHPEAAKAARQMAAARIAAEQVRFIDKGSLARAYPPQGMPDRHRADDFLVAYLEGDLSDEQKVALEALLKTDPQVAKAWALIQRTRVERDLIVFMDKTALKKREVKVIPIWSRPAVRYAAAASVALLLGLWWIARDGVPEEKFANDPPVKEQPVQDQKEQGDEGPKVQPSSDTANVDQDHSEGSQQPISPEERPGSPSRDLQNELEPTEQRRSPARVDRMDPLLASGSEPSRGTPRGGGPVPHVPVAMDVPEELAMAQQNDALTVGQLLAATVRTEVLERPANEARPLDGTDAVALVDRGLQAVGGERSGLEVERTAHRKRFNLRLGQGLAITTSTSR